MEASLGKWQKWGGAVTVLGALMLFYAWIHGATWRDPYAGRKNEIQRTQLHAEVTGRLDRIADRCRTTFSEEMRIEELPPHGPESEVYKELLRDIEEWDASKRPIVRISWCVENDLVMAKSLPPSTAAAQNLTDMYKKITPRLDTLSENTQACHTHLVALKANENGATVAAARKAVGDYKATIKDLNELANSIGTTVHTNSKQLREDLKAAFQRANDAYERHSAITTSTFVLGTLITLLGQFCDKCLPKHEEKRAKTEPAGNSKNA